MALSLRFPLNSERIAPLLTAGLLSCATAPHVPPTPAATAAPNANELLVEGITDLRQRVRSTAWAIEQPTLVQSNLSKPDELSPTHEFSAFSSFDPTQRLQASVADDSSNCYVQLSKEGELVHDLWVSAVQLDRADSPGVHCQMTQDPVNLLTCLPTGAAEPEWITGWGTPRYWEFHHMAQGVCRELRVLIDVDNKDAEKTPHYGSM